MIDIHLAGKDIERIDEVKTALSDEFQVKDLGELNFFLGVQVIKNAENSSIWIGQPSFVEHLLNKYGMGDAKPSKTPVNLSSKLLKASENSELADQEYPSAVGSLLYLSTRTRPDIAFAVGNVARYCSKLTKEHWIAVKHIMRYLRGTCQRIKCCYWLL